MHPRNIKRHEVEIEDETPLAKQIHYRRKTDCIGVTQADTGCLHEQTFNEFARQADRMAAFIAEVDPLMAYVRAEIKRNDRKAEMYRKITENVLGAGVLFMLSAIGAWVLHRFKLETGLE